MGGSRASCVFDVASSIRSGRVIEVFVAAGERARGAALPRSDNGPEFIATAILRWFQTPQIETAFIDRRLSERLRAARRRGQQGDHGRPLELFGCASGRPHLWVAKRDDKLAEWRVYEDTPANRRALGIA